MSEGLTEIVEIPAVAVDGQIVLQDPALAKLDYAALKVVAKAMDGEVIYVKMRLIYEKLEVELCGFPSCHRPVGSPGSLWCSSHPLDRGSQSNVG